MSITPRTSNKPKQTAEKRVGNVSAEIRKVRQGCAQWRSRSAQKLGIIASKMRAMSSALDESDFVAVTTWFDGLPASQAAAILLGLAR